MSLPNKSTGAIVEKARAHVMISGRVQGVCFRMYSEEEAAARNICGWVRNLPSGQVEAVFEGDKAAVESILEWCHKGPPAAHVTSVKITWENYTGDFKDFRTTH